MPPFAAPRPWLIPQAEDRETFTRLARHPFMKVCAMKVAPMEKDFYSLDELAVRWNMSVVDILHHAIKGRIKVGVYLYDVCLYGVNSAMRTVGYYTLTGILTVRLVDPNEFCHPGLTARFGAYFADPAFPPEVSEVTSYTDEASCPRPFFQWAPGHDWDHPETDLSKINRYVVGQVTNEQGADTIDLRYFRRDEIVVHPIEVARTDHQLALQYDEPDTVVIESGAAEEVTEDDQPDKRALWQVELRKRLPEIIAANCDPKPKYVRQWLIKNGSRRVIPSVELQTKPDLLYWINDYGHKKRVTLKTISNVLTELRKEGLLLPN